MAKPFRHPKSASSEIETFVCDDGAELVGYAQLRWGAAPPCVLASRPAEIQRIYVDQPWHGKGTAQALMSRVLTAAVQGNADQVWLGVWENNPRAMAFYRKFGFDKVGHHVFQLGDDPQHDWILCRDVRSLRSDQLHPRPHPPRRAALQARPRLQSPNCGGRFSRAAVSASGKSADSSIAAFHVAT